MSWTPKARLELAANPQYYRGRPKLDGVVFTIAAQGATVAAKLMSGEADFLEQLAPPDFAQLSTATDIRAQAYPSFDYTFARFNLRDPAHPERAHPLFADRALRRALSMAVDRATLVKAIVASPRSTWAWR